MKSNAAHQNCRKQVYIQSMLPWMGKIFFLSLYNSIYKELPIDKAPPPGGPGSPSESKITVSVKNMKIYEVVSWITKSFVAL